MSWNYRLVNIRDDESDEDVLEICEVYYNDLGQPVGYCSSSNIASDIEEFWDIFNMYIEAFDKPILKTDDFPENDELTEI